MSALFRGSCLAALALLAACFQTTPPPEDTGRESIPLESSIQVQSQGGCRLDDDCVSGTFCFQDRCVWECQDDASCAAGEHCSGRGRCLASVSVPDAGGLVDEASVSTVSEDLAAIEVVAWPQDSAVAVRPGEPFVSVQLRTGAAVPGGVLRYTVELQGEQGPPRAQRAEGTTEFSLVLPTGKAGADDSEPQTVRLVTPMGARTLYLVPTPPRAGFYAGTFTPPVFGGAGLPLEFAVETVPSQVASLAEADAAFVWIPATTTFLVSLDAPGAPVDYVRRPLVFDASIGAWVAVFSESLAVERYFGGAGVFPHAGRSLRLEISEEDGTTLVGAVADRWSGLFDRRSADGVRSPGLATVAGRFTVERTQRIPAGKTVREGAGASSVPRLMDPPDLTVCPAGIFVAAGPQTSACADVGDTLQFALAEPGTRAACALEVAARAMPEPSLGGMLGALLDPDVPDPQGLSFAGFLEACASEASPLCKASPALLCARELLAHAYREVPANGSAMQQLSEAYDGASQEAFIGRQLAAFHVDAQSRLKWLQSSEAPAFLASTLRDYNEQLLADWKGKVLDAHLSGVFGQLDAAGLAVLTRSPTDPVALANRQELLLELSNSWRAAMDALILLTGRWNVLHQDPARRAAATAVVRTTSQRLYVTAAIIQELNRESGASHLGSSFGSGFSVLMRELVRLSLPFDRLLFARDAEVVASHSLDPDSNTRTMLGELESAARGAVADAASSVDLVLDEAQLSAVDEVTLAARYEDQLLSVRNELIALCGLPVGCSPAEVGVVPACDVQTAAGRCGFEVPRGSGPNALASGSESVSEAGGVLHSLKEAALGRQEAEARLHALAQQASLTGATADAFAEKVAAWDARRRGVAYEVSALLGEITGINDARIDAQLEAIRSQHEVRVRAYARQEAALDHWDELRLSGIEQDMRRLHTINGLGIASSVLGFAADRVDLLAGIFKDAQPAQVGLSTDPSFVGRLGVRFPAYIASSIALTAATTLEATASGLDVMLQGQQKLREAELTALEQLPDLDAMVTENDLAELQAAMEQAQLSRERELSGLKALVDALDRNLELDLAHGRDLQELSDRRDAWRLMLVDAAGLEYGVVQAELTARQRELAYYEVVQRAQLLEGRFRAMQARWQSLEGLLGSPDVIFSFANRMARAESRLDRARRALEDWLVALEYYAVRPFVDQRMAILLARNPAQLEAIANELLRLQRICGGPTTTETVVVSLRDDLLDMGFSNGGENEGATPATSSERLRAVLARAQTPVNRRVAWSATESIGERLDRGSVWAANFTLSPEAFANLGRTCNAKLDSIALRLVGEQLGAGQPVVSLAYDGAAQLRSCQPGIDAYASQFGPDGTSFAKVTAFRTAGRTISPVAGVDGFGPAGTWNATLEGLPLAAGYTVLVDLLHPSNAAIDWSRLEDVQLQLRYTYQDVFPEGQCE